MNAVRRLARYGVFGARLLLPAVGTPRPFKITLALTDRCDCRCEGCRIWTLPKGREMTPQQIGAMLEGVPSIRWVNLTGGEPFLREDLVEVASAVAAALPGVAVLDLPTTGQRTERILDVVQRIRDLPFPRLYVTVSLEGPPDTHDRLRGRPGAFARAVATFDGLRRIPGVRVVFGMTLSTENVHLVRDALRAVRRALPPGAPSPTWRDLHLNVHVKSDHYYANRDAALDPPRRIDDVLAAALRAREASGDPTDRIEATWLRLLPDHLRSGRSPLPCASGSASVFVAAGGDVYPCTVWSRCLGNVFETPLETILASASAEEARRTIARDACPGCWSPCEAFPTIVAAAPRSLLARGARAERRRQARTPS